MPAGRRRYVLAGLLGAVALVAPLVGVLYFRRGAMFSFLRQLPDTVTFSVGEFVHTVDIAALREIAFHERIKSILYAIYVLQAAVASGTFLIALVVFWVLGCSAVFTLTVLAGVLQFIPILGPSITVLVLAALELVAGNVVDALLAEAVSLLSAEADSAQQQLTASRPDDR